MKKILAILLLVVFVFSFSGCSPKTYTLQARGEVGTRVLTFDLEKLLEYYGDAVIVGKVKTSKPIISIYEKSIYENSDEKYEYEADTLNEIEVVEVISGDLKKGDIISVYEHGDGSTYIDLTYGQFGGYLKNDDYVILFLKKIADYEYNYVLQGEKTYREKDGTYVIEAASEVKILTNYYTTHVCQGRIWLTADKQIDQERNEALLNWTGEGMEVIRTGETYDEFVARLKSVIAGLSTAE